MVETHQFGSTVFQRSAKQMMLFELKSWLGRTFKKPRPASNPYLHIGCGPNVMPGFENMDFYVFRGRGRNDHLPDVEHDLRFPLPYPDESFDGAFSEHCLEHLLPNHAIHLLQEIRRVLRPGTVFRCGVPDLQKYVAYYTGEEVDPEFSKFSSGCEAIWSLTQNFGHLSVWDSSMLGRQLRNAGFSAVTRREFREGQNPALLVDHENHRSETVYMEAVR